MSACLFGQNLFPDPFTLSYPMRSFARSLKAVLLLPMLWLGFSTSASSQCSTCGPTDQEYTFYLKTTGGNSGINTKLSGGGKQCGVGDKIVISMNQNGVYDLEVKTDFPEPYMDEHENTVSCFFDDVRMPFREVLLWRLVVGGRTCD